MSNTNQLQTTADRELLSALILNADLSRLSQPDKVKYYNGYCERLGLDPFTKPFELLKLQGKETLYCTRSGAQQLNKLHSVSHVITSRELIDQVGVYQVTAKASLPNGRCTESIGAVNIAGLKGDAYANAIMKAETKAKRRATLDLLGLGVLDESELESIQNAQTVSIDLIQTVKPENLKPTEKVHTAQVITEAPPTSLFNHNALGSKDKPLISNLSFKKAMEYAETDPSIYEKTKKKYTLHPDQDRMLKNIYYQKNQKQ